MSAPDVARAIEVVEASRLTHLQWRDYWLSVGDPADCACERDHVAEASTAGGIEHHLERIEAYDHVLRVLRAHP